MNWLRPRSAAHTRNRKRLGFEQFEDRSTPTVSAISASFNGAHIDAGNTIWFNSAGTVTGLGSGTSSLHITDATVSFSANGTPYTVTVPDTTVTITPLATKATTSYSSDGWLITTPSSFNGNVFLGGASLRAPGSGGLLGGLLGGLGLTGGLPGGINNVTWRANFTTDTPGLTVNWQWGAAVYSNFSSPLTNLSVKSVDDASVDNFHNADRAGTPESTKLYLVAGARGNGGTNYTGSYSASASVTPVAPAQASLSGTVYEELDGVDGFTAGDEAVGGMEIQLSGTDELGHAVSQSVLTDSSGNYTFTGLSAGNYSITRIQADSYNDGPAHVGTVNGVEDGAQAQNAVWSIALASGDAGANYNFEVYEVAY
jgi:SdrD B-like domain